VVERAYDLRIVLIVYRMRLLGKSMVSHVRTPLRLKPTWKGNLLLLLVAMLISASIAFCLHNNMVTGAPDGARQMAAAKLPASSQR
jgi:hypothetical protein